jgi:uncharacterized protein YjbI with pentapeptide repeats/uncharacterized protein
MSADTTPAERSALDACIALTEPDNPGIDRAALDERLRRRDLRIDGQDFSGRDLAAQSFSGKVLVDVNFNGARLRGADLTGAVICRSDLRDADLTGAHLDRALIGGNTRLNGANLTNASATAMMIADADGTVRIDGADLRGAHVMCDPYEGWSRCIAMGVDFVSMVRADLRGATIHLLCCRTSGLATAQLDGVTTQLDVYEEMDFVRLAAGTGDAGRITFFPEYGYSGSRTAFTGAELRRLAAVISRMTSASAHPSFECSRARTRVEAVICADPKLAALDRALSWLWSRVEHTRQQVDAQKAWLMARARCPIDDSVRRDLPVEQGCIGRAYIERIKELAPSAARATIESGRYTTDPPLVLSRGADAQLAEKYLAARGFRQDEILVEDLKGGARKISGEGVWANGHVCGFEAMEAETERVGARFRITDDLAALRDDNYSVSFVITPQVVIRAGGSNQFQCGARGGWSDVYFRQPGQSLR